MCIARVYAQVKGRVRTAAYERVEHQIAGSRLRYVSHDEAQGRVHAGIACVRAKDALMRLSLTLLLRR